MVFALWVITKSDMFPSTCLSMNLSNYFEPDDVIQYGRRDLTKSRATYEC